MSAESKPQIDRKCLLTINDELSRMAGRLDVIIAASNPRKESLIEITSIYENVAYIFVYLEGNERHLEYEPLLEQRDKFLKNPELYASLSRLMSKLTCSDPEAEEVRRNWLGWFQERARAKDQDLDETLKEIQQLANQILGRVQEDQAKLLKRLGVHLGIANPDAVFYRIVSETKKPDTRRKLAQAWNKQLDRRKDELCDIVDQIVDVRRLQAKEKGFNTVLEQTFERCSVSESNAQTLITTYLARALDSHSKLASNISNVTGCADRPMDHFGYYVRSGLTGAGLPMFSLDNCLDFLFTIADSVFDVAVTRTERENQHAINVAVSSGRQRFGRISFDLLDTGRRHFSSDSIPVIRTRTKTDMIEPAGHVLCRYHHPSNGTRLITFESAHSIFHEFGHALTHLMLRKRIPSQSGLDYLPVERLEDLSSWFEKWVFHPDLATHLFLSGPDTQGLAQCQHVKRLEFQRTNLDRAVTAALDFDVHRRAEGGLRDSLKVLDEQFSISEHCFLGDLLANFTKPMFRAHPGASFVYLWGAAYGAENFAPFCNLRVGDIRQSKQVVDSFSSCFDPDEQSTEPSVRAVFDFYGTVL